AALAGLARGWPTGKSPTLTPQAEQALAAWLPKLSPAARGRLVTLTSRWGSTALDKYAAEIAAGFLAQVRDDKASVADRVAAAGQLVDFRRADPATARQLLDLITPQAPPELAAGLLAAAGRSESRETVRAIVALLPALTPGVRPAAVQVLLGRGDGTAALLEAAQRGAVRLTDLSLEQRQALLSHPNRQFANRARNLLERGGGLPDPDREKVVQQFLPLT